MKHASMTRQSLFAASPRITLTILMISFVGAQPGCDRNPAGATRNIQTTEPSTSAANDGNRSPKSIIGRWAGRASAENESTDLVLTINKADGSYSALMDLPQMDVIGWPASSVDVRGSGRVDIVIPSDSGPQPMALSRTGDRLTGDWRMPGWETPAKIELERSGQTDLHPHVVEPIRFQSGAITLAGTIRMPKGEGPFPGVVFVHGSGALSRHAYHHDAIALADRGIASLAYDKRGVGESEGDYRTADYHELAADARAAATELAKHANVTSEHVGFVGTSQGGWVAPLAASEWPASFVIVVSGAVVPPAQEDKWDVVRRLRLAGLGKDAETEAIFVMREWDHGLRTGEWDRFRAARKAAESKPWFGASGMQSQSTFHTNITPAYAKWYRRFIDYDPIPTLKSLTIPVLYMLAREDEHINAMETYEILQQQFVRSEGNVQTILFEGYDHSMRHLDDRGERLRWPTRPAGFVDIQAIFIQQATSAGG